MNLAQRAHGNVVTYNEQSLVWTRPAKRTAFSSACMHTHRSSDSPCLFKGSFHLLHPPSKQLSYPNVVPLYPVATICLSGFTTMAPTALFMQFERVAAT